MNVEEGKCLKELLLASITSASPSSPALVFRDHERDLERVIPYGELLSLSSALEAELKEKGVNSREVLCIHLDQDTPEILDYIIVLITALRIDCPFHFLERFSLVGMEEIGSRILLSACKPPVLGHTAGASTSSLASIPLLLSLLPRPTKSLDFKDVVYLVHTSGTTGVKKLVLATHSSVAPNIQDFLHIFNPLPKDTVFMCSPPTFDPHIIDVFVALCSGASLFLIPRKLKSKGDLYRKLFLGESRVSILQTTPSLLDRIMEGHPVPPSLRVVAVGGEASKASTSAILTMLWESGCRIFHLYGLTEMSVWQSAVALDTPRLLSAPPISMGNAKQLLSQTLVSLNDEDELIVRSPSRHCIVDGAEVAEYRTGDLGHWEGDLLFCDGRTDDIVKVLGKKVSLARVEAVMTKALNTKVVCTTEDSFLVAVVEDLKDHEMAVLEVIKAARENLQTHELPSRIRMVAEVPMNVHGKMDRRRVGEEVSRSKETLEQWLHQIWAILTGTGPCLSDNFVLSGGDSFSALLLVNQLESRLGELPAQVLDIILNRQFRHVLEMVKGGGGVGRVKRIKREREDQPEEEKVSPEPHPGVIWKVRGRSSSSYGVKAKGWHWEGDSRVILEEAWKCDLHSCVDSSPLYLKVGERELVAIGSHSGEVVLLELHTGLEVWRIDLTDRVEASPMVSWCGSRLLVASYNHKIYSLSITDGGIAWEFVTGGMVKCSPLVTRQGVFVGSYDRRLYRLSHSGKQLWSVQVSQGSILASPLVLPSGHLAVATLDGVLAAIGVNDGVVQWRCNLGKPIFGSPLLLHQGTSGLLLVPSTEGALISIDEEGKEKWRLVTSGPVFSSPVYLKDQDASEEVQEIACSALVGDHGGSVTCVSSCGNLVWKRVVGAAVAGAPDTQGGGLAVCTTQGEVVLLNQKKGEEMGRVMLNGEVFSSPLLLGNKLVVGCRDNYLYCLNIVPEEKDQLICISGAENCDQVLPGDLMRIKRSSPDPYSPATELAQLNKAQ